MLKFKIIYEYFMHTSDIRFILRNLISNKDTSSTLRVIPKNSLSLDQKKKSRQGPTDRECQPIFEYIRLSATTYTRRYLLIKTRRYPKSDREFASASMSTTFTSYPSSLSGPRSSGRSTTTNALDFICGTCPLSSNKSLLKRTPQPEIHSFRRYLRLKI